MEEKQISEKESLELISQMIQSTKQEMEIGSGNHFLFYGYFTLVLSGIIYLLVYFTHNFSWSTAWFLMFLPWTVMMYKERKNKPKVITYIGSIISKVWSVICWLFVFTVLMITIQYLIYGKVGYGVMLPLSLLYCGIGCSITGIIIKEKTLTYSPLIAIALALYMLLFMLVNQSSLLVWSLYFGFAFIPMMIIPGHILNKKSRKQC